MFRQIFARSNLMALALLGALLAPEPAAAQRLFQRGRGASPVDSYNSGYGGYDYTAPGYFPSSSGYYTVPNSSGYYTVPNYYANDPTTGYQSFFPRQIGQGYPGYGYFGTRNTGDAFGIDRAVLINVAVPTNAEISFEDARTMQNGSFRQFISPPLTPGREYTYKVEVKWSEDGSEVNRTRRFTVHAGDIVNLSFNSNIASESSSTN